MTTINVKLTMLSDWHVGSGTGRPGNVDSLVIRDADDFPYIPAKTLTGIWRDAAERLVYGLDDGNVGDWSKWVDVIFGSQPALAREESAPDAEPPRPAALSVMPARFSDTFRSIIKRQKDPRFPSALTFVKPGVEIDPKSGSAKTDFLSFEEVARSGAVLSCVCALDTDGWTPEQQHTALALLWGASKLVERLGGKRRRGTGRCSMTLEKLDYQKWLGDNGKPADLPKRNNGHQSATETTAEIPASTAWAEVELELELLAPVSVAARTLGNITETLDYIPGTLLLPEITKKLEASVPDIRRHVASGNFQVLPATPVVNGDRGLPVPSVLAHKKVGGGVHVKGSVINRLVENPASINPTPGTTSDPQIKPFRVGYVGRNTRTEEGKDRLPSFKKTPLSLLTHNTVDDKTQRPTEDVGGVYSREAIATGTRLRTVVRWRGDANTLSAALSNLTTITIGTSRKDDYGAAKLSIIKRKPGEPPAIPKAALHEHEGSNYLIVWLLSDTLLRNDDLKPSTLATSLATEIEARLKVTSKTVTVTPPELPFINECISSLIDTRRIDSWHTGWGLPRPTLVAMKAGSVAVFKVTGGIDSDTLQALQDEGIGERRGEGYGQFCFNHPLLTSALATWEAAPPPDDPSVSKESGEASSQELSEEEKDFAKIVELAVWRDSLRHAAIGVTIEEDLFKNAFGFALGGEGGAPKLSQLGGLRSVVRRLTNENVKIVRDWLTHLKGTDNRYNKWKGDSFVRACALFGGKIEQGDLTWKDEKDSSWKNKIWKILAGQDPPTLVGQQGERVKELREQLWAEAVRTLIDVGLRAHKRAVESSPKNRKEEETDVQTN